MPTCCECQEVLGRTEFTKSQLKKPPAKRCCRGCQGGDTEETGDLNSTPKLRFEVGQRVECRYINDWFPGTVMIHWHQEHDHKVFPYQIRLDDGRQILSPDDSDRCIRACNVPAPPCWICFDDEQTKDNFIVRDCGCRGASGYVHLECLAKFAVSKSRTGDDRDFNPFIQCVTCRQMFERGSRSAVALAEAGYSEYPDESSDPFWHKFAITNLARIKLRNGDFLGARKLLEERIAFLRRNIELGEVGSLHRVVAQNDLVANLQCVSEVYEQVKALAEMKTALDEALRINDRNRGTRDPSHYFGDKAHNLFGLSKHAQLEGDNGKALEYAEAALHAAKEQGYESNISNVQFPCGELLVACGDVEKGFKYMQESMLVDARLYGSNNTTVRYKKSRLRKIIEMCT